MYNREYFDSIFKEGQINASSPWGMEWRAYIRCRNKTLMCLIKKTFTYKNGTIIDVGCSTGEFTDCYIKDAIANSNHIWGIDISQNAIDADNRKYKALIETGHVSFKQGELPFIQTNRQGGVICIDVFEYFTKEQKIAALKNLEVILEEGLPLLLELPLEHEDADDFISLVGDTFKIQNVDWFYGAIWYNIFEKRFNWIVKQFYFNKSQKWGIKKFLAWVLYIISKNYPLIATICFINRLAFKNRPSHIILIVQKK